MQTIIEKMKFSGRTHGPSSVARAIIGKNTNAVESTARGSPVASVAITMGGIKW
ncbi:hypothetical protein Pla52n_48970 [Stieleria varia]|uniref:Uncharacterized protein n=1 Tax=Stieleria varia TaxID=2528005 RepID=A0A5C6AEI6_9BACT|nr:hypothetical protein Pla52n_48970 [Stieleria varia]